MVLKIVLPDGKCIDGRFFCVAVEKEEWKADMLLDWLKIYTDTPKDQVIVFTNSKLKVDWICDALKYLGFNAAGLVRYILNVIMISLLHLSLH